MYNRCVFFFREPIHFGSQHLADKSNRYEGTVLVNKAVG